MVVNVFCFVQLFYAFVVCVFGTNFTLPHHVIPVNWKGILKSIEIPILEQSHIQAYMRCREPGIGANKGKECIEVANVVHDLRASPPAPLRQERGD